MLYSLVESSLPEEILATDEVEKNRLTKLFQFLSTEVENEERINMAVNGFGMSSAGEKQERIKLLKEKFEIKDIPCNHPTWHG